MKYVLLSILFLIPLSSFSQSSEEKEQVRKTVEAFFQGFHNRDSVQMRSVFHPEAVVQTIGKNRSGETTLKTEELEKVIQSIASIPDTLDFKEVLHAFHIQIDGEMANVWTPYSFYINGNLSHCGVNNFQLVNLNQEWKVVYLVDTRRREGCQDPDQKGN